MAHALLGRAPPLVFTAAASAGKGPYLELDTKGHMDLIRSIVFTSHGSQLISASDDKTIRVWDVATGRIVRTIRGEIGDGDPGKIYARTQRPEAKWRAMSVTTISCWPPPLTETARRHRRWQRQRDSSVER